MSFFLESVSHSLLNCAKCFFVFSSGIHIVTPPPHTSHRLQPLDVSVFGPFKAAFNRFVDNFMQIHPEKTFTLYEVGEAVGEAYGLAFTPNNIRKGFSSTGRP